ncbi:MAG TPA: DUF1573 domain-containing protein [Chitinophagaceae bacterium]|nr:DUF1573 domain-containing protein [Chitinophagaceae bacterium]
MQLRHFIYLPVLGMLALASCGENREDYKAKGGLDPALINNPRSAETADAIAVAGLATMDFEDTAFDFGKMHEGEAASHEFKFTNNGKAPLLIANASGTCGCTVPDYPREPVVPGQSAVISVKFNSTGKTGLQNKSVNIFTNSKKGKHVLTITAEVTN